MILYSINGFKINEDICHHGIKGQKWGVRRFQNPDGTLTDACKKRQANQEFIQKAFGNDDVKMKLAKDKFGKAGVKNIAKLVNNRGFTLEEALKEQSRIKTTLKVVKTAGSAATNILIGKIGSDIISSITPMLVNKFTEFVNDPVKVKQASDTVREMLNNTTLDEQFMEYMRNKQ